MRPHTHTTTGRLLPRTALPAQQHTFQHIHGSTGPCFRRLLSTIVSRSLQEEEEEQKIFLLRQLRLAHHLAAIVVSGHDIIGSLSKKQNKTKPWC